MDEIQPMIKVLEQLINYRDKQIAPDARGSVNLRIKTLRESIDLYCLDIEEADFLSSSTKICTDCTNREINEITPPAKLTTSESLNSVASEFQDGAPLLNSQEDWTETNHSSQNSSENRYISSPGTIIVVPIEDCLPRTSKSFIESQPTSHMKRIWKIYDPPCQGSLKLKLKVFEVEEILAHKEGANRKMHYLVKWKVLLLCFLSNRQFFQNRTQYPL